MSDIRKYEEIDKAMSKKMSKIFTDPSKHIFHSEYDMDNHLDQRGPRGGKIRGRKTICHWCGYHKKNHTATETESI